MSTETVLNNYINNEWRRSSSSEYLNVTNPATTEVLGVVPLSPSAEVDLAAQAAADALVRMAPHTSTRPYPIPLQTEKLA